jgi:long-chain acyl-CoA synthetase
VVGRKRDLIIKGGFEVYPDEVRALLAQHSKVSECRVFGVHDDILGQEIKALIVPMNGNHLSKEELSAYCRQHLAMYKCPKYIEIVNSLTEKTSGVAPPAAPTASDAPSVLDNSSVIS